VRFSRHAKNRMRGARVGQKTVESIVATPDSRAVDSDGNPILSGADDRGRAFEVVIALDDPEFVNTVIPRGRRG
jgi:hypothetical protein